MKTSFKTALCTVLMLCLIGTMLAGCAQTGQEWARDPNGLNNGMNNDTQYQGYGNNLVGGRYGNNLMGMDRNNTGQNGIFGGNTTGTNRWSIARDGTISNTPGNTIGSNSTTGNGMPGTGIANRIGGNDSRRASLIESQLKKTGGIGDCVVLVNGDTAVVGLRNNGAGSANMSRLRASIEKRVKQIDSSVRKVMVTDSQDMLTRMSRLGTVGDSKGMANNFMDEFDDLINNISRSMR